MLGFVHFFILRSNFSIKMTHGLFVSDISSSSYMNFTLKSVFITTFSLYVCVCLFMNLLMNFLSRIKHRTQNTHLQKALPRVSSAHASSGGRSRKHFCNKPSVKQQVCYE